MLRILPPLLTAIILLGAGKADSFSVSSDVVITRSYSLHGDEIKADDDDDNDDGSIILHEVRPSPRDPNLEEDEVELFYPTTRRAFVAPNTDKNKVLNIRQTSFGCGRLGATVWPSAIALSSLLAESSSSSSSESFIIDGKRVLELGSGCGLPSLVAKELCNAREICATDYWEIPNESAGERLVPKDLFGANLAYNVGGSLEDGSTSDAAFVRRLDWHDEMGIFKLANEFNPDVIIGSDLVYYPMDTSPLLQTIEILFKAGKANDALLVLPLPPNAEREALPDFRKRLEDGELGDEFEVCMDELVMVEKQGQNGQGNEERHNLLRIRIHRSL